jgi:hypothetical protein
LLNVKEKTSPLARLFEPHEPSSPVTVCEALSLLLHLTVVPTLIVTVSGLKAKSLISISTSPERTGKGDVGAVTGVILGTWTETAEGVSLIIGGNVPAGVGSTFEPQAVSRRIVVEIRSSLVFMRNYFLLVRAKVRLILPLHIVN